MSSSSLLRHILPVLMMAGIPSICMAETCDDPNPIRFSLIPKKNIAEQLDHYRPMLALLEKKLGRKIETLQPASYGSVIEGLLSGSIDIAELGAGSYALAKNRDPSSIQAFATYSHLRGQYNEEGKYYRSLLIVRKDSKFQSVDALMGSSVNLTDPASTSGAIVPQKAFPRTVGMPLDSYFHRVLYAGSHEMAAQSVKKRFSDAAFVASIRLDEAIDAKKFSRDDFRVLWKSERLPNEPTVYRGKLCESLKARIREAYFSESAELLPMLAKLKAVKFLPASDEEYVPIRELVKE
jgi:phosphonate transport system substrate-binding protein